MSQNVYDVLQERGFIAQTTHEELRELLGKEKFFLGRIPSSEPLPCSSGVNSTRSPTRGVTFSWRNFPRPRQANS